SLFPIKRVIAQSLISAASGCGGNTAWALGETITGDAFIKGFIITQGMPFMGDEDILSVEDAVYEDIHISIYPNPVADILYISCSCNIKGRIYNVTGNILKDINIEQGVTHCDVSEMESGLYVLTFISDNIKIKPLKFMHRKN
ncbi:MAG: T9SS type A sorting domain-containing protein, partial [Bacteroidales bacterium]